MPKTGISAALLARLAANMRLSLCHCWGFKLRDGLEVRATVNDRAQAVSVAGTPTFVTGTYSARYSGNPKASRTSMEISGDSMSLDLLLDLSGFPNEGARTRDLRARRFAGAEFWHFAYDWENGDGIVPLTAGTLGNVELRAGQWVAEIRRLVGHYLNTVGEPVLPECPHTFGGPRCGMRVYAETHRLYGDMHPLWQATTAVVLREPMDEASNVKGVASLAPFTRITTARPTVFTGRDYVCTVSGTTGGSEPTWPTTVGATVADGSAEWMAVYARRYEGRITAVTDQRTLVFTPQSHVSNAGGLSTLAGDNITVAGFGTTTAQAGDEFWFDADGPEAATRVLSGGATVTLAEPYRGINPGGPALASYWQSATAGVVTLDAPDDWFGAGVAQFVTGPNKHVPVEIDTWDLGTATLTLQYGAQETIQVGDLVRLHQGCRGRRADCRDKPGTDTGAVLGNMNANLAHYDVPTKLVVFVSAPDNAQ